MSNEQTAVIETETGSPDTAYPETFTKAEAIADQEGFLASLAAATDDVPEARQFSVIEDMAEVPDDFIIVIDSRDTASFKDRPASFVYAMPTYESIISLGDRGVEFAKDCVESILNRKAAAYCSGVNRGDAKFNMPTALAEWLEGAKPASSGVRRMSRVGWNAVNGTLVAAINKLYSDGKSALRINKKELSNCMANDAFAQATHPSIKNWDNIFAAAEKAIKDAAAKEAADVAAKVEGAKVTINLDKDLELLKHWAATREDKEDMPEVEITELSL